LNVQDNKAVLIDAYCQSLRPEISDAKAWALSPKLAQASPLRPSG
jgi:hypothetical protein